MSVNWGYINELVIIALEYIRKYDIPVADRFLTWYEQWDNKPINLHDMSFQQWVIRGIPVVNDLIQSIKTRMKVIDLQLENKYKQLNLSVSDRIKMTKSLRNEYVGLENLIKTFLDCKNKNRYKWFTEWLQQIDQTELVKNEINYLNTECQPIRIKRLVIKKKYYYFY